VDIGAGAASEPFKEIDNEFRLQIAHQARADFCFDSKRGASAEVDCGYSKSLVHRHNEVSRALNAALVAERTIEGFSKSNSDIFDRVVLIHIEIAIALQFKIEGAVAGEQLQHVVEEANAG
jgi:hypothetical protein